MNSLPGTDPARSCTWTAAPVGVSSEVFGPVPVIPSGELPVIVVPSNIELAASERTWNPIND